MKRIFKGDESFGEATRFAICVGEFAECVDRVDMVIAVRSSGAPSAEGLRRGATSAMLAAALFTSPS